MSLLSSLNPLPHSFSLYSFSLLSSFLLTSFLRKVSAKVLVEQERKRQGRTRLLGMIRCLCVYLCVSVG